MGTLRLVERSTCLGCGCACDDIDLLVDDDRIVEARNACALGVAWFGDGHVPARARLSGRDGSVEEALDAAARLVARAARPLVYLAPDISCEAQREGVALADALRAALDSPTSSTVIDSVLAAQDRGRAGATLGEVRNRADAVVFWGVDPALRYPRYWTRYAPEPAGLHVPDGRSSRVVVSVDVGETRGPSDADLRFAVPAHDEGATLMALTAIVAEAANRPRDFQARPKVSGTHERGRRRAARGSSASDGSSRPTLGGPSELTRTLARTLLDARYAVIVADAEPDLAHDPGRAAALVALTQALNGSTRLALSLLRAGGNRSGADSVATWQTGYPAAIDFARGYPRYRPHDGATADRLARGEVDALLVIGSVSGIPAELVLPMAQVPRVVLGPRASESALAHGDVVIDTGIAGIHEAGMALRMDDVPLPLRVAIDGPPSAAVLASALREKAIQYRDALRFWHPRRRGTAGAKG